MKTLSLALFFSLCIVNQSYAWVRGEAPACLVDNQGNGYCYYYSMDSCEHERTVDKFCFWRD